MNTTKHLAILILLALASCGKSGEISYMPPSDEPLAIVNTSPPVTPPLPCDGEECPPFDGEPDCYDDAADGAGDAPADAGEKKTADEPPETDAVADDGAPEIVEEIADSPPVQPPPDDPPVNDPPPDNRPGLPPWWGNPENGQNFERACLRLEDEASRWWLVYQLTGGFFRYAELNAAEHGREVLANGEMTYFKFEPAAGDAIVAKLNHFTGPPLINGNLTIYDPDNYQLFYMNLSYDEPVLGNMNVLQGGVECSGTAAYHAELASWKVLHKCETIGGLGNQISLVINGEPHRVFFKAKRRFEGNVVSPEKVFFPGGIILIDGKEFRFDADIPPDIIKCLAKQQ
jgi:predicted small lipoprotein YifL